MTYAIKTAGPASLIAEADPQNRPVPMAEPKAKKRMWRVLSPRFKEEFCDIDYSNSCAYCIGATFNVHFIYIKNEKFGLDKTLIEINLQIYLN